MFPNVKVQVLLVLLCMPILVTSQAIHCKMDLCGRNCGPERPPPCGTADTGSGYGQTGKGPYAGRDGSRDGYRSSPSGPSRDQYKGPSTPADTCIEVPSQKCPYGYTLDYASYLCAKEAYVAPYYSCGEDGDSKLIEVADGKHICVERVYEDAPIGCGDGYTKIFRLGTKYGHVCIRMAYGEYEAACESPSYSLSTDSYGDRECKYTEESDPAEVCKPPYALDEYHTCVLEDVKPPVLQCPYEYQMKDDWCLKEEGERTPEYSCTSGYPNGDRCVTGYKSTTAAKANCYGPYTLNPDTGKCSKRTWREADSDCDEDDGYRLSSRDGASVCVKAKFVVPTLACDYGFALEDGKCRKEHSAPAELRCADGFQPHSYLPRCINMESRDPEPYCVEGYELERGGLAASCYKEQQREPNVECADGYYLSADGQCYSRQTSEVQYECREGFRLQADGRCLGPCTGEYAEEQQRSSSSSSRPMIQDTVSDVLPGGAQEPPNSQIDIAPLI